MTKSLPDAYDYITINDTYDYIDNYTDSYGNNSISNVFGEHINNIYIYVCTFLVIIGLIGNIVSLKVFMRSGHCQPIILQRHSLILLTLSNTIYLLSFFYVQIIIKIVHSKLFDKSTKDFFNKIYLINENVYACKLIMYTLNVAICLNATITTSFSVERAFVINFPYLGINLRENHDGHFKILIMVLLIFSFLVPSYNLFLVDIVNNRCDAENQSIYFTMTLVFVVTTLLLPFLIITISNVSIIREIFKHKRDQVRRTARPKNRRRLDSTALPDPDLRATPLLDHQVTTERTSQRTSFITSDHLTTNMLIAISISFVVLNLPYFVSWCVLYKNQNNDDVPHLLLIKNITTITQIFFLLNYSMAGGLYFVSGKMYREHLYAILGCKFRRKRLSLSRTS